MPNLVANRALTPLSGLKPSMPLRAQSGTSAPAEPEQVVLPVWITDTFAAKYATRLLQQVRHTPVGKVAQQVIDDPFVFLHQMKIGGLNDSMAAANASIAASVAPNRLAGTIVGAAMGAFSGAGQALLTYPGKSTVIVGAIHGLVMGSIAGNVAVVESRHSRQAVLKAEDRLW